AVLLMDDHINVQNFIHTIGLNDPTSHAEILDLRSAALNIGNYRLLNTKLYVTVEPGIMGLGGVIQARVPELV
ncbi:deaminase, partial [Francisella tularensis subsp. holarctica]